MKKINLLILRCINKKCKFRIISQKIKKSCPLCSGQLIIENNFILREIDKDIGFTTLKKTRRSRR